MSFIGEIHAQHIDQRPSEVLCVLGTNELTKFPCQPATPLRGMSTMSQQSVDYQGAWWAKSADGRSILKWDGSQWQTWTSDDPGPQPPPKLLFETQQATQQASGMPPPPPVAKPSKRRVWLIAGGGHHGASDHRRPCQPRRGGTDPVKPTTSNQPPEEEAAPAEEPDPEPAAQPDPEGSIEGTYDYVLGDFTLTESGYRFVADATVINEGNVGIEVKAMAVWFLSGGDKIKEVRRCACPTAAPSEPAFPSSLPLTRSICTSRSASRPRPASLTPGRRTRSERFTKSKNRS